MATAVPILHDVIFEIAKLVPNPDPSEVSEGRTSIYDTWLARYNDSASSHSSDKNDVRPGVATIGANSDYRPFMFNLGIPSMDVFFIPAPVRKVKVLLHTAQIMLVRLQHEGSSLLVLIGFAPLL